MKTHLFLIGAVSLLGTTLLATSYAANTSEYLHFTRHRDSNGNLLMGPTQHQAEPSVMQKTMMPSQSKTFERRSTDWGMSVQEVKDNEPIQSTWELQSPILADFERRVAYHTQIEGIEAGLTYTFYQDHLGQAKYVFEPQHEDAVKFVDDFHTVKGWISQSYGLPTSSQEIWLDKLYQYDKSLWGQAIKRGHLVMVAEWKNSGTDIVLVLDGGDDSVGIVADFASTTFVVPVSLDTQSQEESVEAIVEETTIQEALPTEPAVDPLVEDLPGQDMTHDIEGSGEFHPEAKVASQGPVSEMNELAEIEQMLNEEYPISVPAEPAMEGSSMGSGIDGPVLDEAVIEAAPDTQTSMTSEEVVHETLDEHSMGEQTLMDEGMSKDHPINSSVDVQASENLMDMSEAMPVEPSSEGQAMEAHPTDEPMMDMSEAMPVEPSSEGQAMEAHPTDEPMMDMSEAMPVEPSSEGQAMEAHPTDKPVMDMSEAMPVEPSSEGQAMEAHPTDKHATDHVMEAETELELQHL